MKHLLFFVAIASFAAVGANAQNKAIKQVKNSSAAMPYQVHYTVVGLGSNAYTMNVLRAWKDFDNNTLDNLVSLFTDDVVGTFSNGMMVKGKVDFIKAVKDYRNSLASASSDVDACTAMRSAEHPEMQVVSIWGTETDTHKDGSVTKTHLNEVWFFNKAGKVYEVHQMSAKEGPDNK